MFGATGLSIERLCEIVANDPLLGHEDSISDRNAMVRAGRALLSSVTRVLLLADIVVVKQLLLAKDKVSIHIRVRIDLNTQILIKSTICK